MREKVANARKIQQLRYKDEPGVNCNADMSTAMIQQYCVLDDDSIALLKETKYTAAVLTEKYTTPSSAIISGMAKGIDSYVHTAFLKKGGYTIAILGNGLDICYPSEHNHLMECIEQTGLLLSEYPPGTRPSRYTFPRRNRLISAWCDQLFVISPTSKSGTLITADYAYKYHREVTILKGMDK